MARTNVKPDALNRRLRRTSLKSFAAPTKADARKNDYHEALKRLDERALGENILDTIRKELGPKSRFKRMRISEVRARKQIALAKALYASRRIASHEYLIFVVAPVEDIHSKRWLSGKYDNELTPISSAIDLIERENGLGLDQYWRRGEGPEEHVRLNREYEAILDRKFDDLLYEFELEDIAEMRRDSRERFDKLRERGRRSIFHDNEYVLALKDLVVQYEKEARQAANAGAYTIAIAGLGAGIEGLLLLRCLRSATKASRAAKALTRRPKSPNDPRTWSFESLIDVCLSCGWLPAIETPIAKYDTAGLSHMLRQMRNYIHPARRARDKPWAETDVRDFADAEAIYLVLLSILGNRSTKTGKVV